MPCASALLNPFAAAMPDASPSYRGRFAPSPTGALHFGSLVGALASYLDARQHQGRWLVRIEDIDPLREPPGAADEILRTLEAHALHWDEPILYQSSRSTAYEAALAELLNSDQAYYCPCSRKELADADGYHTDACRRQEIDRSQPLAIRFRIRSGQLCLKDRIQGSLEFHLQGEKDDFVLKRKEGFYAYQLAVVVDDAAQNITHVVRGCDLIDSLPWQHSLQSALKLPHPSYAHVPVVTNVAGQKLSKQNHSPALCNSEASTNLYRALYALELPPPPDLKGAPPAELLDWAAPLWTPSRLQACRCISEAKLTLTDSSASR